VLRLSFIWKKCKNQAERVIIMVNVKTANIWGANDEDYD